MPVLPEGMPQPEKVRRLDLPQNNLNTALQAETLPPIEEFPNLPTTDDEEDSDYEFDDLPLPGRQHYWNVIQEQYVQPILTQQQRNMEFGPPPYPFQYPANAAPGQGNYNWSDAELGATAYRHNNYKKDPIKSRHRVERFKNNLLKKERYGSGTMGSLQGQLQKARFENPVKAVWLKEKIANRLQDNFTGRGMYYGSGAYKKRRRRRTYRGRGMYYGQGSYGFNDLRKNIASGARFVAKNYSKAATLGSMAATYAGRPEIGALIGSTVQPVTGMANFIGGRGAYNTLFPGMGNDPTTFESVQTEQGNLTVTAMEKVLDVYGNPFKNGISGAVEPFTSFSIALTPGNFTHFPRLAQHAANFKEYEFIQLVFTYKSTLPPNWSTEQVTTGKIIMATEMDVERPLWSTYDEMFGVENKTEGLITGLSEQDRVHTHGVECDPNLLTQAGLKFVRTKGITGDMRLKDYDLGRFHMGMFGTGSNLANQMIGELYVYYKVQFKNQRMYSSLGYSIPVSIWKNEHLGSFTHIDDLDGILSECYSFKSDKSSTCDFNNIDALIEASPKLNLGPLGTTNSYVHGMDIKITFPSNLRGDFEIIFTQYGRKMIPHTITTEQDQANNFFDFNDELLPIKPLEPLVTGTTILNNDIYYYSKPSNHSVQTGIDMLQFKTHIHLGQAISTIDNSVTITIPLFVTTGVTPGNRDGTASLRSAYYDTITTPTNQDTGPTMVLQLRETSLTIQQYNAQQRIGEKGFPFSKVNGIL